MGGNPRLTHGLKLIARSPPDDVTLAPKGSQDELLKGMMCKFAKRFLKRG